MSGLIAVLWYCCWTTIQCFDYRELRKPCLNDFCGNCLMTFSCAFPRRPVNIFVEANESLLEKTGHCCRNCNKPISAIVMRVCVFKCRIKIRIEGKKRTTNDCTYRCKYNWSCLMWSLWARPKVITLTEW